jgi:hypothetical protein
VLGLGWLLGGAGMFLWLKSWLGHHGALVAALAYTYLPHQIATVYVRGAWGESLFLGLLPWAMLAVTFLVTSPRLLILPVAVSFWFMLGLSHLGLAIWAFIFVVLLLLIVHPRQSLLPILAALLGTGAAVTLYRFLSPVVVAPPISFTDHFLYPFQLFSAYWGFGPSRPGWNDGLSLQLGVAAVGLAIVAVFLWQHPASNSSIRRTDRRVLFFSGAVVIGVLLQLSPAAFVWNIPMPPAYSLAGTLTYPWQLLGLTGLALAVLAGVVLWLDPRLAHWPLFGAIIILIILSSYSYLAPQFVQVDQFVAEGPQAQLGDTQLALLDHHFQVSISGNTAGLERGETAIPLAVHGPLQANQKLLLNVVWQPLHPFKENLKVFVHLVDPHGNVLAQYDGYPRSGDYPTSQWIPGELIEDSYPLQLPDNAPPGPYRAFIGLYNERTMTRLPVPTDPEGRVILDVK